MARTVFSPRELYDFGQSRRFPSDASQAAFLLGGIGTGNVSVGARGELRDWEIFNNPSKGTKLPYSFFAIRVDSGHGQPVARVLESRLGPPFAKSHGFKSYEVAGLPRFATSTMRGEYPFVWVDLKDEELPVSVTMEAFTPFIPLNSDDSGIPGAVIRYAVTNTSRRPLEVSVVGSLANVSSFDGFDLFQNVRLADEVENEIREKSGMTGVFMRPTSPVADHARCGNLAILTREPDVTLKRAWLPAVWTDHIQDFWDDFCDDGRLEVESHIDGVAGKLHGGGRLKIGSVGAYATVAPGERRVFEFAISWYFPNRAKCWEGEARGGGTDCTATIRNYYATRWTDAWDAGTYMLENLERLENLTRDFHRALFTTTVPSYVLDAVSANITVLRSPTCFRIEDGSFLGWEGCHDQKGCCSGSCTHVWNYAQTVAFLFPDLEQSMRRIEFNLETDEKGSMAFRSNAKFDLPRFGFLPATDGQMGTIIRLYRDWKLSGNDELLRAVWKKASLALDFAFEYWDSDDDFVLDSQQHNTYDIEFYGPNSLTNSMFFAALKAGQRMAEHLGDKEHAATYAEALAKGSRRMDELLWGGDYYIQKIDDVDEYRYQYGTGCLADQLLGQMLAHVAGLGYVLPEEHVKQAVQSIFDCNFKTGFSDYHSVQRTYILNDEKGLLLCSWPHGGRPKLPFVYSDEVWTGIEYQVAAHLIYEGLVDEGLTIVKAVRERHDGYRRNPWNEVECGHHYARAMASWAVLTALSGFSYDLTGDGESGSTAGHARRGKSAGTIGFDPKINTHNFSTFFSTGRCWGIYTQRQNRQGIERNLEILYGDGANITLEGLHQ